jgi:hypothetical protein
VVTSTFLAGVNAVESSFQAVSTSAEVMSVSVEMYRFWTSVTEKASSLERRSRRVRVIVRPRLERPPGQS